METKTPNSKADLDTFKTKNKLHVSELFDLAGDAIYLAEVATGKIVDCNSTACKKLGYSKKEILNLTVGDLNTTYISLKEEQKVWSSLKPNKPITIEGEHKRKDGTSFPVEIRISILNNNDTTKVLGIARDITDRKKTKEILWDRKQKLIKAEKLAKMGFLNWDLKTNTIELSESVIKMFDLKLKTNIVNPEVIIKMIHPDDFDFVQKNLNAAITGKKPYNIDHRIVLADGNILWVQAHGELTYDEKGNKKSFLATALDITEEIKIKEELIKAKEKAEESSRLKSEFLHNMSHEIRTPMNGILGFSELLGIPNLSKEKQQHYTTIIQNSGKLLLRIIDDILEISRLGTKQVKVINEPICLNNLLEELFSIFDAKAKENRTPLYLNNALSDDESIIKTDISKIHKIISNLLENALKYTNVGSIELGYYLEKNKLKIYVKDTGIGILPTKLDTIFDRFTQANEHPLNNNASGLGLGLSIAKENAELLDGTLEATSEVMKGSTFTLTLPYLNLNQKNNSETHNKETKCTILIAEDEEVNVLYLETIIHAFDDFTIIHAKNGKEAVDIIKQDETINLILMDLKMPIMNGFDAALAIKKIRPNIKIIAQTAYSTTNEKQKAIKCGCDEFISKPLHKEKVKELLKKYIK